MTDHKGDRFYNRVGGDRIESRQIDELIGLSRGLIADDVVNQSEIEFLQKWLAANSEISEQPVIRVLCTRVNEILSDGIATEDEKIDLFETLQRFSSSDIVAYVRRRKFIHIGRRISTNSVLYFEKSLLARKYAAG